MLSKSIFALLLFLSVHMSLVSSGPRPRRTSANTKVCFELESLNLKCNQKNDFIFCIYLIRM